MCHIMLVAIETLTTQSNKMLGIMLNIIFFCDYVIKNYKQMINIFDK